MTGLGHLLGVRDREEEIKETPWFLLGKLDENRTHKSRGGWGDVWMWR